MLEHFRTADAALFRELGEICARLTRSAELLERLLAGDRADEASLTDAIRQADREAHDLACDVATRTLKAFVMRVDRMELHELAVAVDDAVEAMDDAASHAWALHASQAPAPLRGLAAAVTAVARELGDAVQAVGISHARVAASVSRLHGAKDEGESLYYAGVKAIFTDPADALHVLRWKAVYDKTLELLQRCVAVGQHLERIAEGYG